MKLTHVRLLVDDFPTIRDFYRDVVGLELLVDASSALYVEFSSGGMHLGIYDRAMMARVTGPGPVEGSGRCLITFDDPDVDARFERLVAAGAPAVREPHDQETWGLRVAIVADPEGNLIEINHPLPGTTSPPS